MTQLLDQIRFGNMCHENMYWIDRTSYLEKLFADITFFSFPANSSDTTKAELQRIKNSIDRVSEKSRQEILKRYLEFDRKGTHFFKELVANIPTIINKEEFNGMIDAIAVDINPLIYKLKEFFQRPRPFQLAQAYKLKLFPYKTFSGSGSPSYPSALLFQAKVIAGVIGNRCPELFANMQTLVTDVYNSRIALGANYESDLNVAIFAGEKVLQDEEFKIKYKL